jgi:hypothetical protein
MTNEELMQVSAVLEKISSKSSGKGNGNSHFIWLAVSHFLLVISFLLHSVGGLF